MLEPTFSLELSNCWRPSYEEKTFDLFPVMDRTGYGDRINRGAKIVADRKFMLRNKKDN